MEHMEHIEPYLNIRSNAISDESVFKIDYPEIDCTNPPGINQTAGGEILFKTSNSATWYLPSKSYMLIEGQIQLNGAPITTTTLPTGNVLSYPGITFVNNGLMHMFNTVTYKLNGTILETFTWAGITTTINNILTKDKDYQAIESMWYPDGYTTNADFSNDGYVKRWQAVLNTSGGAANLYKFGCLVPLANIFNFCDYNNKVNYGMLHELSFFRQSTDNYALHGSITGNQSYVNGLPHYSNVMAQISAGAGGVAFAPVPGNYSIFLTKFKWILPNVTPSDDVKITLNEIFVKKENQQIAFLNKRLDSQQNLGAGSNTFNWNLSNTTGLSKIRFIVIGVQLFNRSSPITNAGAGLSPVNATGAPAVAGWPTTLAFAAQNNNIGNNSILYNNSVFDAIDISTLYAYVDNVRYPIQEQQSSILVNTTEKWYESYKDFRKYYSNSNRDDSAMDYFQFQKNPLYVIDVSKQPNRIANSTVTTSINLTLNNPLPNPATAYVVTYFDTCYNLKGTEITNKF